MRIEPDRLVEISDRAVVIALGLVCNERSVINVA
jgi:hypothetical protein